MNAITTPDEDEWEPTPGFGGEVMISARVYDAHRGGIALKSLSPENYLRACERGDLACQRGPNKRPPNPSPRAVAWYLIRESEKSEDGWRRAERAEPLIRRALGLMERAGN